MHALYGIKLGYEANVNASLSSLQCDGKQGKNAKKNPDEYEWYPTRLCSLWDEYIGRVFGLSQEISIESNDAELLAKHISKTVL